MKRWWPLVALATAQFVMVLDQSVMNVDVPLVTTETFGLTFARFGRIEPGGFHSGVAEKPSSATASSE